MTEQIYLHEHGCSVPKEIQAICGAIAKFDYGSGYGYRCTSCSAVLGSVGMPRACRELMEQEDVVRKLKGMHV